MEVLIVVTMSHYCHISALNNGDESDIIIREAEGYYFCDFNFEQNNEKVNLPRGCMMAYLTARNSYSSLNHQRQPVARETNNPGFCNPDRSPVYFFVANWGEFERLDQQQQYHL